MGMHTGGMRNIATKRLYMCLLVCAWEDQRKISTVAICHKISGVLYGNTVQWSAHTIQLF